MYAESGAIQAITIRMYPAMNQGSRKNKSSAAKKLKNAMGFQVPHFSFSSCESWLIQSVVRTQARNKTQ